MLAFCAHSQQVTLGREGSRMIMVSVSRLRPTTWALSPTYENAQHVIGGGGTTPAIGRDRDFGCRDGGGG